MSKGDRGGKYAGKKLGKGEYGNGRAGDRRFIGDESAGIKREFEGSESNTYTFYREGVGYYTVMATSMDEALRLAKQHGFTRRNYKKR